ncbi:MAG: ABC transporter ATP-binding protein [Phycisphaerales bacterium]|jgi:iron complex transport system ATP-binding protein|nr:ABC transporter ATP-binding protein [Phycisphaerales bacterium]
MLQCEGVRIQQGGFEIGPLDCAVHPGRITAVVGPNAAGKSTLLNAMAGLMRPSAGCVRLHGRDVHQLGDRARAESLAMLPQRPALDCALTIEQLVGLGRLRLARHGSRVGDAIASCGLSQVRRRGVDSLSVGQAQRAHVARVLAQAGPETVLVMDEPTAPMDHTWAARTWDLLAAHARGGGGVLVAVHDLAVAADRADDALLLGGGQLAAAGPVAEVLQPEALQAVFGASFEWAARADGSPWLVPSG